MLAVGIANGQKIPVEVHGALGLACCAGGETNQTHVILRGVCGGKMLVTRFRHQGFKAAVLVIPPSDDARKIACVVLCFLQLINEPMIA